MITFDEAQTIVEQAIRNQYPPDDFVVADFGYENDEVYVVIAGTVFDVTGVGDPGTMTVNSPARLVNKETGELTQIFVTLDNEPAENLREIGNWPE